MTYQEAVKRAKLYTMACWWPSKVTGLKNPDWNGIIGELKHEVETSLYRGETDRAGICNYLVKRFGF